MARLPSHACHCDGCKRLDAAEFAAIVAANYPPRARAEMDRETAAAECAELERAYAAPAITGARIVCRLERED